MSYNSAIENETFRLLDPSDPNKSLVIEISEGPFAGIQYSYGVIEFHIENKDQEDEHGRMRFDIVPEDPTQKHLINDEEFIQTVGNILMAILEGSLESNEYRIEKENNVSDSEE